MQAVLAAIPLALVIAAMTIAGWRAAAAGLLGLSVALALAITTFGFGGDYRGAPAATAGALAEALFTAATILWIIFPALCLYELQSRSGAFETIRSGLARLTEDPRLQVLLVAWFFGLFMEGVAGFGAPVALAAPILVGLGFTPLHAVTLALIGHAAGVSFGAIGAPVLPQIEATGLSGTELALPAALLHAALGWALAMALFTMAAPGRPTLAAWRWPALAAIAFFLPCLLLAWLVGPELPTLGGAIIGGALFCFFVLRSRAIAFSSEPKAGSHEENASNQRSGSFHGFNETVKQSGGGSASSTPLRAMTIAALPYLVVLALILATRLAPPARDLLRSFRLSWTLFDDFSGRMEPLYHPGTILVVGFLLGGLLQGRSLRDLRVAMGAAAARLAPVALALAAMLALSRVLVHASMIETLAQAAAASGPAWPLLAPFVGVLGSFVTGSATSSNILFTEFQQATADTLAAPAAMLHGAQNFGAAIGNIISPHNIVAGAATVGLAAGREGEVMRTTILVCVLYAAAGGALTLLLLRMGL